ncbi:MAG: DUF5103 domain-containing protein [Bacteroidales bacterium]|nr:DUF5103 domain-containing protein [Bacteroidales bacterium]
MKMKVCLLLLLSLLLPMSSAAESAYRTLTLDGRYRTLQVYPANSPAQAPVIPLQGQERIQIGFDELSHDYHRLTYRVIHCNADWTRSELNELEYMAGFTQNDVPEGTPSMGTHAEYTHYSLVLPNEQVQLKLSGNYAVEITDRDEPEAGPLLWACFSLLDRQVGIDAGVSTLTDAGYRSETQQLEFELKTGFASIERPDTDLKILVRQNRRTDNQVVGVRPSMAGSGVIHYQHRPELIFDGGNEYRRCDFSSYKLGGLNIDRIVYQKPYYHALLFRAEPRLTGYTYDEDQNGRYLTDTRQGREEVDVRADYFWVHFSLALPRPLERGALYLLGEMTENRIDEETRLDYNDETGCYEQQLFLKQGICNYLFMYADSTETGDAAWNAPLSSRPAEGSYWATENGYQIFVYYRPFGARYDRLIGYTEISSRQ